MYKLILLDADNTIFDYDRAEEFALYESLKQFNILGDFNSIRSKYRVINSSLWKLLETKGITKSKIKTERFRLLFKELNLNISESDFSKYYLEKLGEGNFLIGGAEELCDYLSKKYRLVILTNGIKEVQDNRIKNSRIYKYIEDIITSDEAKTDKPDKEIFQWTFDKISFTEKDKAIIIGDSLGSDIQGGINFGIDTLWFNYNLIDNTSGLKPTYSVNKLEEIYSIL